jgi:hypothetical protein
MNSYITDALAREHADQLMADAAAARRARRVRSARRRPTAPSRPRARHTGPLPRGAVTVPETT